MSLKIGIAQVNFTVGDLKGNKEKIISFIKKAKQNKVDLVSFPELSLVGYPAEDLLLKPSFINDNLKILKEIVNFTEDIFVVLGFIDKNGSDIYNAAAIIGQKKIIGKYYKNFLPNYGVFDEKRYFSAGENIFLFSCKSHLIGVTICEDIWHPEGPLKKEAESGAQIIINLSASPYHCGKIKQREEIFCQQAKENKVFISYNNLIGGQDELVFDGRSMFINAEGKVVKRADAFQEDFIFLDYPESKEIIYPVREIIREEEIYRALCLGLKDYVEKNGFREVVLGISGGIDSALTAVIAADALGKDAVRLVFMPSPYTSIESRQDSEILARNLGIDLINIPITKIFEEYKKELAKVFSKLPADITEENIQARIRGNVLMALSNKFGWLVLTTGNKSEISCGYCTLYGDMVGGFGVIKDIFKTDVYKISEWRNKIAKKNIIPERILIKEPSAELKPNQKDVDTLPPYPILDKILTLYIQEDKSAEEIIKDGFDKGLVLKVIRMVDRSEYKRRQAAPGIKVTPKAFGKDRRMPITNKYLQQ